MKPSELCVTLETSRRLKEAGFPQKDSCFMHFDEWCILPRDRILEAGEERGITCAAPTLAEVLRELPASPRVSRENGMYHAETFDLSGDSEGMPYAALPGYMLGPQHENPAEAAALLWLAINEEVPA